MRLDRLSGSTVFSSIELAEKGKVPSEVQILRVGKFNHPVHGEFEITRQVLAEMKKNFDNRVRGIDISFDYFHDSDKEASGWPKNLELREGGNELWATGVEWTPRAEKKLSERELRYFSPDFAFQWQDPESRKIHNNVLFGGGLTNRPFVKEMQPIVATETKGEEMKELEELKAANLKLTEEKTALEKKLSEAPTAEKVADLEKQLGEVKAENEKLVAAQEDAAKAKQLAEKEAEFTKLLSEGKACAAQKDAFMKGDMGEFIKLAQPINLNGKGSTETAGKESREDRVLKLAEEKMKQDTKLSKVEAITLANKEIKE